MGFKTDDLVTLSPDDATMLQTALIAAGTWVQGCPASRGMFSAASMAALLNSAAWCLERLEMAPQCMPYHLERVDDYRPPCAPTYEAYVAAFQARVDRYTKAKDCNACNGHGFVPMRLPPEPCGCQGATPVSAFACDDGAE